MAVFIAKINKNDIIEYMKLKTKNSKLPSFFKPLFWSYKFSSVDPRKNKRTVIVNTINYGNWRHWKWIVDFYGREELKRAIEEIPQSEFRPSALKLISLLLDVKKLKYASRGDYIRAQKNI